MSDPREQLRALERQGEDYIWRAAEAAGKAWDADREALALASQAAARIRDAGAEIRRIHELEREVARLTAECARLVAQATKDLNESASFAGMIESLTAECARLRDALREAEPDVERMNWLCTDWAAAEAKIGLVLMDFSARGERLIAGSELRAEIDAARRAALAACPPETPK